MNHKHGKDEYWKDKLTADITKILNASSTEKIELSMFAVIFSYSGCVGFIQGLLVHAPHRVDHFELFANGYFSISIGYFIHDKSADVCWIGELELRRKTIKFG